MREVVRGLCGGCAGLRAGFVWDGSLIGDSFDKP